MKVGSKRAIFGVIWWGLLDLVWESATTPTDIWERYPKFFLAAPLSTSGHPTPDESVLPAARVNVIAAAIRFY